MRTLELVRSLNNSEVAKFEETVKAQKRTSLQRLYAALKKYRNREGVPGNDELYKSSFEKEYSSDKNYLLRNELRLLNELLYNHFINETFNQNLRKHKSTYFLWLAQSFYDRKLNNAFSADIDRFIDYSKEHFRPEDAVKLLELKNLWMIYNAEISVDSLKNQIKENELLKDEQIKLLKHRLREAEARQAYLQVRLGGLEEHLEENSDDNRTEPISTIYLKSKEEDPYESYLIFKRYSYQTSGLKRIEMIKQMLILDDQHKFDGPKQSLVGQVAALNNIAVEYIKEGQFAKADEYMEESIRRLEKEKQPMRTWIIPNYIANQLNQGNYQKGIDFYKKFEANLPGTADAPLSHIYASYCHLFLSQPDEALSTLSLNEKLNDFQQVIARLVYLIVFIQRNDYMLALNECKNLSRSLKSNQTSYSETYILITGLFLRYINAMMLARNQRKAEIKHIKDDMHTNKNLKNLLVFDFALRWLSAALDKKD